ncbi:MAG: hypothetical protein ACLRVT_04140 [Oscillospiraceae bacterium]
MGLFSPVKQTMGRLVRMVRRIPSQWLSPSCCHGAGGTAVQL